MPFTPREESYVHSKCGEPTKPNASHLSANVSEFVPSWLRAETAAHFQQSYPTSSKAGDCSKSISQQQFTKKKTVSKLFQVSDNMRTFVKSISLEN